MHTPQKFDRPSTAYTPPHFPIDDPAPGRRHRGIAPPTRRREPRGLPQREMILGGAPKAAEIPQTPKVVCASEEVAALVVSCHALLKKNDFEQDHRLVRMVPAVALEVIEGRELSPRQARRINVLVSNAWNDPKSFPAAVAIEHILGMFRIDDDGRVETIIDRAATRALGESKRTRLTTALRV